MTRNQPPDQIPVTGFLRQPQVLALVPFSHATLWRHVEKGTFPRPLKLSERVTAWRREDVAAWIASRAAVAATPCVKRASQGALA